MSFRCSPRRLAGILLAALFVPGLAAAAGSCERLVATGNPEYPPYLWRDPQDPKRLIGANADLLQRLGKELGVRIDVLYSGSWEKAQEEVTSGRADLLAGAYLTLARLGSLSSEGLYLTLSHNSACNDPWLRGQLAKKMTELSAAGVPVTLLQDNLERWKAQQLPASGASSTTQESDL